MDFRKAIGYDSYQYMENVEITLSRLTPEQVRI